MSLNLWKSLSNRADQMADRAHSETNSLADWEAVREERRLEFWRCLGLDPDMDRCDLAIRETSTFSGSGFRARNLGFQVLPDCWGSAAIYYPDPMPEKPAPAVLYVCGHARNGLWHYQYCPIMWARRGYVCLIVDTIEQSDNRGEHHGLYTGAQDSWLAMGYTAAGGEAWNSLRALDALRKDPAVDPERIGVTGISGGGALSIYVAILDEKIKALSSLCGLSTPRDAITNRRLFGHCDCFYPHNVFARDISEYAALLAPRAAMFCFGDFDPLFVPEEAAAFVERTRKIYRLHGLEDHCVHMAHSCGHEDHPVFTEATQKLFDRHVAGEEHPIIPRGQHELPESVTSVFQGQPPEPNHLDLLPQLLSRRGRLRLPSGPEEWPSLRQEALASLPALCLEEKCAWEPELTWNQELMVRSLHTGHIGGVQVTMEAVRRKAAKKLLIGVAGYGEYYHHPLTRLGRVGDQISMVGYEPRLSTLVGSPDAAGPRAGAEGVPDYWRRLTAAMVLTGETPVMMTINDLLQLVDYLARKEEFAGQEIYLCGAGEAAVACLYAALKDERVTGVLLEGLAASHLQQGPILGSLRAFDLPEAVGLMAPRKVGLVSSAHGNWNWPRQVYDRLGCSSLLVEGDDVASVYARILVQ